MTSIPEIAQKVLGNRIIQLESVCVSLEEAKKLNNSINAAHAWVWNPYKHYPEFELKPVEHVVLKDEELITLPKLKYNQGKWQLYNTDVFVAWEQVEEMIKKDIFYFAPLKPL